LNNGLKVKRLGPELHPNNELGGSLLTSSDVPEKESLDSLQISTRGVEDNDHCLEYVPREKTSTHQCKSQKESVKEDTLVR
jgi:hypothetical protein